METNETLSFEAVIGHRRSTAAAAAMKGGGSVFGRQREIVFINGNRN